ncbi:MAG: hypothetical protein HKN43_03575, partial [Rhodothermales bacterium]|nr:hypothetical protein [Rhodothermales bacterium]
MINYLLYGPMRKLILFGLAALIMQFNVSRAQVLDSVDVEIIVYDYGYYEFPYDQCGAGIYARWPDRKAQALDVDSTTYGSYTLIAEGERADGFYVPSGGQTYSWPRLNVVIPKGYFGHWP